MTLITKDTNLLGDADGELFMRVIRVTADLTVPDLDEAKAFYTDFLGFDAQDMGLDWVTRVVVPSSGEHIQLLSRDATGPENPLLSVKVDDVDEAYAIAQRLGYEIVHPLTTEPWGIRRFFVRAPGGAVLNIAQHHDPNE
ncbi:MULTISPECIES: VOC family protein [unclassified Pseudofrankia]|uniref:VOC family protein n=1 Tax=unclassified Pseudofrankia TaxID=2994372 RepID=UPI000B2ABB26|nr:MULTISPECIES: VOC family protein [unclassified Pseudofrankia]MDT3440778.1 VOC family protein [Pseudofrankia sp. BMG5.37]